MRVREVPGSAEAAGPTTEAAPPESALPRDTTPTWELEMLISGAVVFGLLQLPGVVDGVYDRLYPRLGADPQYALRLGYVYLKTILFALIIAFLVHLAARAYWVALVGVRSVFRGGVRWERSRLGPITRQVWQERMPSLETTIERFDNFSSTVFAVCFSVVWLLLFSVLALAVAGGIGYGVSRLAGVDLAIPVVQGLIAALLLVPAATRTVDRRLGARLRPGGIAWRMLHRAARAQYWSMGWELFGPAFQTLVTGRRRRAVYVALVGGLGACLALSFLSIMLRRQEISLASYDALPSGAGRYVVDYRYYADQRTPGDRSTTLPSIQSDIIRDPYLRLFVPYRPSRDDAALAASCPGLRAGAAGQTGSSAPADGAAARVLACLARIHAVTVDGRPLDALEFRFYTEPGTGVRGTLGYIPTAGLSQGGHVLRVRMGEGEPPVEIPFWI
ncbi:MAG: hypothetical protein IRZ00_18555 [Gemmatimonadetes bacterium]|nr:hypothetical protein [Gemmatimonadota bacterium]